ncbi:hypothetical protein J6590_007590 [Homalodisca vitripennis]|nr:hypothetical protein J6590_007590 [Homalodisca vitripennis]
MRRYGPDRAVTLNAHNGTLPGPTHSYCLPLLAERIAHTWISLPNLNVWTGFRYPPFDNILRRSHVDLHQCEHAVYGSSGLDHTMGGMLRVRLDISHR